MSIEGPDHWLSKLQGPSLSSAGRSLRIPPWPYVYVPLVREDGDSRLDKSEDYPFLHTDLDTEVTVPPALIDELTTLGRGWAFAHPESLRKRRAKSSVHSVLATAG